MKIECRNTEASFRLNKKVVQLAALIIKNNCARLFLFAIIGDSLFLLNGLLSLVVLMSNNGGKAPVIHSRGELSFSFEGNPNFGPKSYPPANEILNSNQVK